MWYIYVIRCNDGTLYTGATTDIGRRVKEHNKKKGGRYTRSRLPVKLVYNEKCATRSKALRREAEIKSYPRVEKLSLVMRRRHSG